MRVTPLLICSLLAAMFTPAVFAQADDQKGYIEPDFSASLFPSGTIGTFSERSELTRALAMLAVEEETPMATRAKIVCVMNSLDEGNYDAVRINHHLRWKLPLPTVATAIDINGQRTNFGPPVPTLLSRARQICATATGGGKARHELAACLLEIIKDVDPDIQTSDVIAEFNLAKADWSAMINSGYSDASTPLRMATVPSSTNGSFARKQTSVHGLMVAQLAGNQFAGEASKMNATVLPSDRPGEASYVRFNQEVGPMMTSALGEVQKFLALRHDGFPAGFQIEIGFQEQYSMKDGPSAAVACGLLLDSLIQGFELHPQFAVTGDLNADGTVQPVGGIDGKIRGATKRGCQFVAIPRQNEEDLRDILILDGLAPLYGIQVFTIEKYDEAKALALTGDGTDVKVKESVELFATLQTALRRATNVEALLKNPQMQERLRKVLELTPHHASAKMLLLRGMGRDPKVLSISGSLTAIERGALPMIQAVRSGTIGEGTSGNQLGDAVFGLRRVRDKLDPRTWPCADAVTDYATLLRQVEQSPPSNAKQRAEMGQKLRVLGTNVVKQYDALENDPAIREER